MHGRVKVKSSAQQEAEKKAIRLEKMKSYQAAMETIFNKRKQGHNDEEMLKITGLLLMGNPDITTLWNIRRQVLLSMSEQGDNEEMDKMLERDLDLTKQCLMSNPKSYGAWHHRYWCLGLMAAPSWQRELSLCNKYLSLDERNFHCWDFRRLVIAKAAIPVEDELKYSSERIFTNFSNYSSWHYRSKILSILHPSCSNEQSCISECKRREELELVQNAAFTDPDDSSAWFYHKWLLGRPSNLPVKQAAMVLKYYPDHIMLATAQSIELKDIVQVLCDDQPLLNTAWRPLTDGLVSDSIWLLHDALHFSQAQKVAVFLSTGEKIEVKNDQPLTMIVPQCSQEQDLQTVAVLRQELDNCAKLMELEPDSKWTLYTMTLIMKALDSKNFHTQIVEGYTRLGDLDGQRRNYYLDQRTQFVVMSKPILGVLHVDLSRQQLTYVPCKERFCLCESLNLCGNLLSSVDSLLPYLVECRNLNLDHTQIKDLNGVLPASLKVVSLCHTPLSQDPEKLLSLRHRFPAVTFVAEDSAK